MIEKTITLGAIIGENTQMITFYAQVLQSKNLDLDTKVDLNFKLAKVTENQGNTAQASNHYTQIIQLVENEKQQTVLHFYYLAKAYKASNNKQKAINFAWKALKNTAIPTQKTNKTEKAVFLSAEAMQEARDILAQLLRFDEVTDTTFIVHTVEKGEGLNDIQKMYDVDERCLREWNFLEGNELIEGMKIKVCKKVDWTRDRKENEALPPNAYIYHTVNQGESIISIAQRYNKTVQQLQAENSNSLTIITVGQKIWVGRYFMQCGCEK
ncbi:MAG: LysM peptidoglycan-binding domain-containing protein [Cytophagales bacterium]|nr:MAG: LysM peptidoglycan-binding domain-containing protein [Cytophagales bacterium]